MYQYYLCLATIVAGTEHTHSQLSTTFLMFRHSQRGEDIGDKGCNRHLCDVADED